MKRAVVLLRETEAMHAHEICATRGQPYCTRDTVLRRVQRQQATAAMLAATEIENEDGQVFNLAEVQAKSVSNPNIRRGELMTRIRGCEDYAQAEGYAGVFLGLTTPSRFHATIKATEPASTARWAKVAAGVLLLVLELGAFGVAAQWLQHSRVLRALGWFVLALEITLMSLAQISIGSSASTAIHQAPVKETAPHAAGAGFRLPPQADAKPVEQRQTFGRWSVQMPGNRTAAELAALAALGAAAPGHAAPSVPQVSVPASGVLTQGRQGVLTQGQRAQAQQAPQQAEAGPGQAGLFEDGAVLTQGHPHVLVQGQQEDAQKAHRARANDGGRRDTGTDPSDDGSRFQRVRKAIRAGKLEPTIRAIKAQENTGDDVARRYLQALEAEGLVERRGRTWVKRAA